MLLLTQTEVKKVRKISSNYDQERFDKFALSAQQENLRMWLGDALYLDLITNPTDSKYTELLEGKTYIKDGETVQFFGLYTYLSFIWLYIFTVEGDAFQSDVGTVAFMDQPTFKTPISRTNTSKQFQSQAIIYKNNAIDFLNENQTLYTLWKGTNKDNRTKFQFIPM